MILNLPLYYYHHYYSTTTTTTTTTKPYSLNVEDLLLGTSKMIIFDFKNEICTVKFTSMKNPLCILSVLLFVVLRNEMYVMNSAVCQSYAEMKCMQ